MDTMRKSHAQLLVEERTGRTLPELLWDLYIERRHTQEEIADALQVSRATVKNWLGEFGISRDDRPAVAL